MNSGSSLDVQSDTAMIGAWDALTVQNNAEREAWGFRQQGANYSANASVLNSTAKNASTAGLIGAGSSLLSGASQFTGAWSTPSVSTATPGGVSGMSNDIFGQAKSKLAMPKMNTGTTWF